jgi:MFS transporter, DHA1 family, inner membrane transport protein
MSAVLAPPPVQASERTVQRASWAMLAGNFAIGCGVMVVAGSMNDLVRSLQVSVPLAGQLVAVAAVAMGGGAPLLAAWLGGLDRRRLLTGALLWYALGHLLCALAPSYAALWPLRAATVLAAAVFTPQAAAAINVLAPPAQRGKAMTLVFMGWSLSSVIGMPLHSYIGQTWGWRWAFVLVALLSLAAALWVWRAVPTGVRPAPLSLRGWGRVLRNPLLMGLVGVTLISGAGQFTLFSYFAPYYAQVLGASAEGVSLLFLWFGAFGLLGNVLLTRWIDRLGAATCVTLGLCLVAASLLLWPLPTTVAGMLVVVVPWALGCFSTNSAQQARVAAAAPAVAPALLALNTSAIYLGQALGAATGGGIVAGVGYGALSWAGLAWMAVAVALSVGLSRHMAKMPAQAA